MTPDPALAPTGIAGLDDILGGGLLRNRLYLVEGDPGSGKTTLGLQVLLAAVGRGEKCMYVTLSETHEELSEVAKGHGWNLAGIRITELAAPESTLMPEQENTIFHASEIELSETTRRVLNEVDEVQPRIVIFDSLSEMRLLAQNALRYRRQILALKQFFVGRQCTVLLLDDRTSDSADLQLQSLAHGVLSLERKSPEYGVMQRRLQVVKLRGRDFRAGFHDYAILKGGLSVFPRLVASEHSTAYARDTLSSGIAQLDDIMGGGLDRGTSTLLIGPAGTGKSTVATQFVVAAAQRGERAALFLFEETERTLLQRSASLGIDLEKQITAGRVVLRQIDPGSMSIGQLVQELRNQVDMGARVVVIDSLNGYMNAMPEARFLSVQLHEVLTYLGQKGVTTLLVAAQLGIIGTQMRSEVEASYLADTVVLLRYFEAAGSVRQAMSVVKKRSGSHERTIREYSFGPEGIRVGPALTDFHGILSGTPTFSGQTGSLQRK
jgi:circadian clock protein KaiC